jgi:hypothetical protein
LLKFDHDRFASILSSSACPRGGLFTDAPPPEPFATLLAEADVQCIIAPAEGDTA